MEELNYWSEKGGQHKNVCLGPIIVIFYYSQFYRCVHLFVCLVIFEFFLLVPHLSLTWCVCVLVFHENKYKTEDARAVKFMFGRKLWPYKIYFNIVWTLENCPFQPTNDNLFQAACTSNVSPGTLREDPSKWAETLSFRTLSQIAVECNRNVSQCEASLK